ncbi:MAG: archaeal proteasome endopeptidase complex subunit beta [Nitrososphaerales archaeon]
MIHHGTTTVGMVCTDGIVLATDTRAIAGGYFIAHRAVKKIQKIGDHLALTMAGGVADAQSVVDTIRYYANIYKLEKREPMPVKSAARLASNIFFSARLFPYIADVIVGGVDEKGGAIYNVDLFGSLTEDKYHSTGSGSPVAFGILESEYREELTTEEAIPIAVKAVNASIQRNAGTGDGFDVAVITKDGYREFSKEEKEAVLKKISGTHS